MMMEDARNKKKDVCARKDLGEVIRPSIKVSDRPAPYLDGRTGHNR